MRGEKTGVRSTCGAEMGQLNHILKSFSLTFSAKALARNLLRLAARMADLNTFCLEYG
jgi:hypothetical protein